LASFGFGKAKAATAAKHVKPLAPLDQGAVVDLS